MDDIKPMQIVDESYVSLRYNQYIKTIEDKMKKHQTPHNRKFKQGFFVPKCPIKCMNIMETPEPQPIVYRSSWERDLMEWLDTSKPVIRWASEVLRILYKNPIKNKMTFYVPDFYVEYIDNTKQVKKMLIEVKPLKESVLSETSNGYDKMCWVVNQFKWKAAIEFCKKRNIEFKVMHEKNFGFN